MWLFKESCYRSKSSELLNLLFRARVWKFGRKTKEWVKLLLRPAGHVIGGFKGTAWWRRREWSNLKPSFHSPQMSLCENMKSPSAFSNLYPAALWPLRVPGKVSKVALQYRTEHRKFPGGRRWSVLGCNGNNCKVTKRRRGTDLNVDHGEEQWSFWWG